MERKKKERKGICIVGKHVTLETLNKESCSFHYHIRWPQLNALHADGSLKPVDGVLEHAKDDEGRLPDYTLEWLIVGSVLRYLREIPNRGLSSKYGWYLAQQLRKGSVVARANIADIQRHR